MNQSTAEKFVNIFLWGADNYGVRFILPRQLEQIPTTEEALEKGYEPYADPRSWPIGSSRFMRWGGTTGADLELDEVDVPRGAEAYVASGCHYTCQKDITDQFQISVQFYRKPTESGCE